MTNNTYGWAGKILWIDLTKGKITTVSSWDFEPEKYIGGVGLNSRIFWELGAPTVEAFHPDSPLLISVGPLTGAPGPFSRAEISGIAPQCYPQELFAYSGFGGKFPRNPADLLRCPHCLVTAGDQGRFRDASCTTFN